MYLLDTDHLSVLERGGVQAQRLLQKLSNVNPAQVAASIISYQEQTQGWLGFINKAQPIDKQVMPYKELKRQLTNYCKIPVLDFDEQAAQEFQRLKKLYPRLDTMDLKIASVALANRTILLTRNSKDFGNIAGLTIEDWT